MASSGAADPTRAPSADQDSKRKRDADDYGDGSDDEEEDVGDVHMSKIDKRAHHNALERKRRDHIKESFAVLHDALPPQPDDKTLSSRAQILNKATDYIQEMRDRNREYQAEMEELKRQNALLIAQGAGAGRI